MLNNRYDFSEELTLKRHREGVKIVNDKVQSSQDVLPLTKLFQLPFCVYFNDHDHRVQNINAIGADVCGYTSLNDALGRTMFDIAPKTVATQVIQNEEKVAVAHKKQLFEEEIFLKNGDFFQSLTTIFPWYNQENKIIGTMGTAIVLGNHNLAKSLSFLCETGLLNPTHSIIPQSTQVGYAKFAFSKREKECLELLLRGETAKKIGQRLNLSYRTIEHYIENIKNKMGVSSKSEIIIKINDELLHS